MAIDLGTLRQDPVYRLLEQGYTPLTGESQSEFVHRVGGTQMVAGRTAGEMAMRVGVPSTGTPASAVEQAVETISDPVSALPGGALAGAGLTALGLGSLVAPLGIAYGLSQAIGVQYPWETGPGEGFIAPWSRDIVKDETGRWVTRATRPDLFNGGAPSTALVPQAAAAGAIAGVVGPRVVKMWDTGYTDAQGVYHPGWPFGMTSDGRIHTVTKSGIRKSWKPYRSVVLGKNPSPRMLGRAMTKLAQFDMVHEKIKKLARRLKT